MSRATLISLMLLSVLCVSCRTRTDRGRSVGAGPRASSARETADMLKADFDRLNDLPNSFSLNLQPPAVLLDARSSADQQDVYAVIKQTPGVANAPWNVVEVVSDNVNFYSLGVRPGDTVKCYLFPDSETRTRQRLTGELDAQMVTHEATDLIVAQVLDELTLQVVGGVTPPRDFEIRVPESEALQQPGMNVAILDKLRAQGKVNEFGVAVPAGNLPLDQLGQGVPTMAWPPRVEIWRVQDTRMKAISRALGSYARRGEPALGWEPAPDAEEIERLVESFNRWLRSQQAPPAYDPPKLLGTLPKSLQDDSRLGPMISEQALRAATLEPHEGQLLQEAAWCRDVGHWVAGPEFDALPRAIRLFDWVTRNVALTTSPRVANHRPWHSLVYGRGTPEQRAWLFASLCRQQRIACCVITIPVDAGDANWLWCGVVDRDQLYLFDPQLGLPVPSGEEVAALAQVMQSESPLRALDLPDHAYPVNADNVASARVDLVADPFVISGRAKSLDAQQGGERALALYEDLDARAEQLQEVEDVGEVTLWDYPFVNLRRRLRLAAATTPLAERSRGAAATDFQPFAWVPRLWKARSLHLRGLVETEREAKKKGVLHDPVNDHRAAAQLYLHKRVRPSQKTLTEGVMNEDRRGIYLKSKSDATYWLGLLKYEQQAPSQSATWLRNDVLQAPEARSRRSGVRYNLARALEAMQKLPEAADLLSADDSPQQYGNQVRANRLRNQNPGG